MYDKKTDALQTICLLRTSPRTSQTEWLVNDVLAKVRECLFSFADIGTSKGELQKLRAGGTTSWTEALALKRTRTTEVTSRAILTIPRNSLFMRVFLWAWCTNPKKVNLCTLVWGILLFPITLVWLAKGYRFIPRTAFAFAVLALPYAAIGRWGVALYFLGLGIIITVVYWMTNVPIGNEKLERVLSWVTEHMSEGAGWILNHVPGEVFSFLGKMQNLLAATHLAQFFAFIGTYVRATKERTCLLVQIV